MDGLGPFFCNAMIVDGCLCGFKLVVITASLPPPVVWTILLLCNMIEASLVCSIFTDSIVVGRELKL